MMWSRINGGCVFCLRCLLRLVLFYAFGRLFNHKLGSNHDVLHCWILCHNRDILIYTRIASCLLVGGDEWIVEWIFFWSERACGCNSNELPNLFGLLFLLSNCIFVVKNSCARLEWDDSLILLSILWGVYLFITYIANGDVKDECWWACVHIVFQLCLVEHLVW